MLNEDVKLWFECTLGDKSHMNLFGKIIFSPLVVVIGLFWMALDFLFTKKQVQSM